MDRNLLLHLSFTVCFFAVPLFAKTINVPADQPTIQKGISASSNGDTVVVAPGTYRENINFQGKAITVESSDGPEVTIIDGGGLSSVVTFSSNETLSSVLKGFTVRNGSATITGDYEGGGIAIESASPTIVDNVVEDNLANSGGGGIGVSSGSPLIQGNTIRNNGQSPLVDFGVGGGGISVSEAGSAQIIGNIIQNNSWNNSGAGFGGGISLSNSGSTLIENNIIEGNVAGTYGAGIVTYGDESGTVIVQNLITGNSAPNYDSGLYLNSTLAVLANNTIADGPNAPYSSSYVVLAYPDTSTIIANNAIVASYVTTSAFACGNSIVPQNFYNNDVFSSKGAAYLVCTDQTGTNGNISADPEFVGTSNFRLKGGSPAIDAGSNTAPDLQSTDLAGNPRIINGTDDPMAIVDIGGYEFVPVIFSPKGLNFGVQPVGSSTSKTIKLTNAQNKALNIFSISAPTGYSVHGCGPSLAAFTSCTLTVTFHPVAARTFKGELVGVDNAGNSPQAASLSGRGR
jgi:Right handed beta helix region/Abnormal spindle-like microcephaly-assoc'd, ASPM-SPD-2-Hydin